jgi:hypothetical protein
MFRRAKSGGLRAFCNAFLFGLIVAASFVISTPVTSGVERPKRVLLVSLDKTNIPDPSTQHPAILTPLDDVLPACTRFRRAHAQSTTTLKDRVVDPNGEVVHGAKVN